MRCQIPLKLLQYYTLLSLLTFIGVQILKFFSVSNPTWIFHYLNDFLTIPLVARVSLHAVWWIKKDRSIRLNIFTVFSLVILFSFYFEYYLPQQSYRYTADIWDVFCYVLGGFLFLMLQKIE